MQQEFKKELAAILDYWIRYTRDEANGGFYGQIGNDNSVVASAPKGAVLNARILWSFAAAYNLEAEGFNADGRYLDMAGRAYEYIVRHFADPDYGGVYWTVDASGYPLDTKKQVYAIAFTIYAFSEFFMASGLEAAKDHAVRLYRDLLEHACDRQRGGYYEAFGRQWEAISDLRLSDKDANEQKSMNTHLHVLEAFTNLYRIWPDDGLRDRILDLLHDFTAYIIDEETGHLKLFFDEGWNSRSQLVSYGHDIEAAWLLLEAAEVIRDEDWTARMKALAVKMALAAAEGLDIDGALCYEKDLASGHFVAEKHWWVQAEAMVGFFNAWQISADPGFLELSKRIWGFVKMRIIDHQHGEWFWGVFPNGRPMVSEDKVGLWKCPYHNSRALIELIRRWDAQLN